jgi:hypothetical protein
VQQGVEDPGRLGLVLGLADQGQQFAQPLYRLIAEDMA